MCCNNIGKILLEMPKAKQTLVDKTTYPPSILAATGDKRFQTLTTVRLE